MDILLSVVNISHCVDALAALLYTSNLHYFIVRAIGFLWDLTSYLFVAHAASSHYDGVRSHRRLASRFKHVINILNGFLALTLIINCDSIRYLWQ